MGCASIPAGLFPAWRELFTCLGLATALLGSARPESSAGLTAGNFATRLTVTSVQARANYGSARAAIGRQFLVLATSWENRIDAKLADERGLAPAYGVPDLAMHLYLVTDGAHRGELRGNLDDGSGRHSIGDLVLGKPGATVAGDVVFEIPAGKYASADLRFYDDTAGDFSLALAGQTVEARPLQAAQKNAVGEFAIFAVADPDRTVIAPRGFRAIAVDLRGRSDWLGTKEAPAYDPSVTPGTMVKRVNLLDWPEVRQYLTVVADGAYAFPPAEGGDLPDTPRFIPEFFTGWRIVFFVPADAHSLELVAEMPHAGTDEGTIDLPPVAVSSHRAESGAGWFFPGHCRSKMKCLPCPVASRRTATFAGESAGEGKQFVVLDVGVTNTGDTGEFFQPAEQLLLLDADGSELPPDAVTAEGPHRPMDRVHFAPHTFRRFETVYRVDVSVNHPKLSYHGGSFMQVYELTPCPVKAVSQKTCPRLCAGRECRACRDPAV